MGDILAVDVGTSSLKLGVFDGNLKQLCESQHPYSVNYHNDCFVDIEPDKWWYALQACCADVRGWLSEVSVVSLSVTTPALTPMTEEGEALSPAVLMLDGRSHAQALSIRSKVGDPYFLRETCNLPASGGSSLSSILWFAEHRPDIWSATSKFGHCNTYFAKRLTGRWAIDPSTTSITGLYNTARNDLTWNEHVLKSAGICEDRLPLLMHSYDVVGNVLPQIADGLGLPRRCVVLCGGNDAVLAALAGGLTEPGDVNITSGTCDVASAFTDRPLASSNHNVRCHVLPGLWLTFFVLNAGGDALEWFRKVFCSELSSTAFYERYVPSVLHRFFEAPDIDEREAGLPNYLPYLFGNRYDSTRAKASIEGLTRTTTRDDLLVAVVRGNYACLGEHLRQIASSLKLTGRASLSGGASKIEETVKARRRWTGDFAYACQNHSSMRGAAMLGCIHLTGRT